MEGSPGWIRHPLDPVPEGLAPKEILDEVPIWRRDWSEIWWIRIGGTDYVFRSPTRGEVVRHDDNLRSAPAQAQGEFVENCLLKPKEFPDEMSAGEFLTLYSSIWEASGLANPERSLETLAEIEGVVYSEQQGYLLTILKAFPGLLPDTVDQWQPEKVLYHLALAKALLGLEPINLNTNRTNSNQFVRQQPGPEPEQQSGYGLDWENDLQEFQNADL